MRIFLGLRLTRMVVAMVLARSPRAGEAPDACAGLSNRPVRSVVPAAADGALDVISRILAIKVGEIWNQHLEFRCYCGLRSCICSLGGQQCLPNARF
jgi:hypothetical protein